MTKLKPIEKPQFYGAIGIPGFEFDKWFDKYVAPLNALIEGAVEVWSEAGWGGIGHSSNLWGKEIRPSDTHKAYLIGIEPIVQESAADILKEWVERMECLHISKFVGNELEMFDRAKAALAREVKK